MTFLLFLCLIALIAYSIWLRNRIHDLDQRVSDLSYGTAANHELAALRKRIEVLEQVGKPDPIIVPPEPMVAEPPVVPPPPSTTHTAILVEERPTSIPIPDLSPPIHEPSLQDRLREAVGNEEWETLVGGSLLNKLGALVLVIGIALFLGYSFTHLHAGGRATVSLTVSIAILGAGIWTEHRPRFRVFARGLIGAGWAALYVTAYAMYAIPEASVISNPYVGSVGVLLVAVGMIGHSLKYRVQAITGVAYFAAFAAIAAAPTTPFATASIVPLAVSLLYLSAKFRWSSIALFGLAATYLTAVSKADPTAPLYGGQTLLLVFWGLFEAFDFLRMKRRESGSIEYLFPINTVAFLGLSYATWTNHEPELRWFAAALGAALFLGNAIVRSLIRSPKSFPEGVSLEHRLRQGSYEGPFLISATLAALAIVGRVPGVWTSVGLAIEGELIYLAGLWMRSIFLQMTGAGVFVFSLMQLNKSVLYPSKVSLFGRSIWASTPSAVLHAALFYLNRALRSSNFGFSTVATSIAALVIMVEVPDGWVGAIWFLFGAVLFGVGFRKQAFDLRCQSYVLFFVGVLVSVGSLAESGWLPLMLSLITAYLLSRFPHRLQEESRRFSIGIAAAVTILAASLLWKIVPYEYLAVAWAGLALLLFEMGNHRSPAALRWALLPMAALTAIAAIILRGETVAHTNLWICVAAWVATIRLTMYPAEGTTELEKTSIRDAISAMGTIAAMFWINQTFPDTSVSLIWNLLAIGLFLAGLRLNVFSIRIQSYLLIGFSFVSAFVLGIASIPLYFSLPMVGTFYLLQWLTARSEDQHAQAVLSVMGTTLLGAILYDKASGGLVTVAWGVEGLVLLGIGFALGERILRLQGLGLLLICILKLFFYDLRNLETMYRILSFIALGLILLAVSWIYSRFRDHIKKLL